MSKQTYISRDVKDRIQTDDDKIFRLSCDSEHEGNLLACDIEEVAEYTGTQFKGIAKNHHNKIVAIFW